ncbi:hypothetical protein HDU98_004723 [Podochytrium sp. JEL0797]|nr:hypothetical protein HDU98_004723 [Podochytrium sp. JEL0797]
MELELADPSGHESSAVTILSTTVCILDDQDREIDIEYLPQVVLFYFAGAWSPASLDFHPLLIRCSRAFVKASEIAVVYVSADRNEEGNRSMLEGTNFHRLPFPLSHGASSHFRALKRSLGLTALPSLVVLDLQASRILTTDGVNEIALFGPLAIEKWIQDGNPSWPFSWILGMRMFYCSVRQHVARVTISVLGLLVGQQRLISPASLARPNASHGLSVFRSLVQLVFGQDPSNNPPAPKASTDLPPTVSPTAFNMDDSQMFPDTASTLSASTAKSMRTVSLDDEDDDNTHEDPPFPFPHSPSRSTSGFHTPPPSPIPILKRSNTGDTALLSMSTGSLLDASLIHMSDSMLSDFRGSRSRSRKGGESEVSDASMIQMTESMMSDFRGKSPRRVSFSPDIGGGFVGCMEEGRGRKRGVAAGASLVVVEKGVWDESDEEE